MKFILDDGKEIELSGEQIEKILKFAKNAGLNFKSGIAIHHNVKIEKFVKGILVDREEIHNLVTYVGEAIVADGITDRGDAVISHGAAGTGSGQTVNSTTLATEVKREAVTSWAQGAGANDNDAIAIFTVTGAGGPYAVTEAGLFNDPAAGTMLVYASFGAKNLADVTESLQITWTITIGDS